MTTHQRKPEPTLHEALQALNEAAYVAYRAGKDTTLYPMLDRQSLRDIMRATDVLVDDNIAALKGDQT